MQHPEAKASALVRTGSEYEDIFSITGDHVLVLDASGIDVSAKGRIFSRHADFGWRRANAKSETLCRENAGAIRPSETRG